MPVKSPYPPCRGLNPDGPASLRQRRAAQKPAPGLHAVAHRPGRAGYPRKTLRNPVPGGRAGDGGSLPGNAPAIVPTQ